jgi:RNA polymerase sigma-70 factor (ECF subfamily)
MTDDRDCVVTRGPAAPATSVGAVGGEQSRQAAHRSADVSVLSTAAYQDWDAIYGDNVGRIYRLMLSKVGNRADAEDLTSQVFVSALKPLRDTSSVGEVRTYLLVTARTVLAKHWRRTLGHRVTEINLDAADVDTAAPADNGARAAVHSQRAERILARLSDRHRRILTLRFLRGYSIREAADELGISVANAKVLQHRALRVAAEVDAGEAG